MWCPPRPPHKGNRRTSGTARSVFGWQWWAGRRVVGEYWLLYSQNVFLEPAQSSMLSAGTPLNRRSGTATLVTPFAQAYSTKGHHCTCWLTSTASELKIVLVSCQRGAAMSRIHAYVTPELAHRKGSTIDSIVAPACAATLPRCLGAEHGMAWLLRCHWGCAGLLVLHALCLLSTLGLCRTAPTPRAAVRWDALDSASACGICVGPGNTTSRVIGVPPTDECGWLI